MKFKNSNKIQNISVVSGFTLIEIIASLVVLSIIFVIAVPIVTSIVDKSERQAYRRSVDNYAHAIENSIMAYKMETGRIAKRIDDLKVEYDGYNVKCDENFINGDGTVYLSHCYVNKQMVKDSKNKDEWYSYGTVKYDYKIGDIITYNDIRFYVIKDVTYGDDYITLLKDDSLTKEEIMLYKDANQSFDVSNSGDILYYSSDSCRSGNYSNCITDYDLSFVKPIVDSWSSDKLLDEDLAKDYTGYKVRILAIDDLNNLGCEQNYCANNEPSFIKNTDVWLMSTIDNTNVMCYSYSQLSSCSVFSYAKRVRPVVNLKKSALAY